MRSMRRPFGPLAGLLFAPSRLLADRPLSSGSDVVTWPGRGELLPDCCDRPLLDELRAESTERQPGQAVGADGRVKVPGHYPLEAGVRVADLVRQAASGGCGLLALRADSSVVANEGSRWFPINAEHMLPLPFWQAVRGTLYNIAIATATALRCSMVRLRRGCGT